MVRVASSDEFWKLGLGAPRGGGGGGGGEYSRFLFSQLSIIFVFYFFTWMVEDASLAIIVP